MQTLLPSICFALSSFCKCPCAVVFPPFRAILTTAAWLMMKTHTQHRDILHFAWNSWGRFFVIWICDFSEVGFKRIKSIWCYWWFKMDTKEWSMLRLNSANKQEFSWRPGHTTVTVQSISVWVQFSTRRAWRGNFGLEYTLLNYSSRPE